MKHTIICDESGTDGKYLVLGALAMPRQNHTILVKELNELRDTLGLRLEGETKWSKVSNKYLSKYEQLVSWFASHIKANHFTFRAHVNHTATPEYTAFGDGDKEKAFYKALYHVLMQSIKRLELSEPDSNVLILLDDKRNKYPRLPVLKSTLNATVKRDMRLEEMISNVEPRDSSGASGEPLIQVVDLLIGAICHVRNGYHTLPHASASKKALISHIETCLSTKLALDTHASATFNIWSFNVGLSLERKVQYKNRPRT